MPAPNDCEIARVFTRRPGQVIADTTFRTDETFEVVVEGEVGQTLLDSGAPYEIGVTVRNLTDGSTTPAQHNVRANHDFLDAGEWDAPTHQEVFGPFNPIPGAFQQGAHMYEVIAYIRARKTDPDVSYARSPLFIVYKHTP